MSEETPTERVKVPMKRVLIFGGKTGWIGQMMAELIKKEGTFCIRVWSSLHNNNDRGRRD
jgi:hypothetical protein